MVAGLVGAFALALVLPLLLLVLVGWWAGRRVAFRTLSLGGAMTTSVVIGLIPFFFWYPSIGVLFHSGGAQFVSPGSEVFSRDLSGHLKGYWHALVFALVPAGMSAAISWVLHVDEYAVHKRRQDKSE